MTDIDVAALRAAAEGATRGEWGVSNDGGGPDLIGYDEDHGDDVFIVRRDRRFNTHAAKNGEADAHFIAAANPAVVLELLDRLAAAEGAVARVPAVVGSPDFVESVVRKTCAVGPNEEPHHTCRLAAEAAVAAVAVLVADNLEGPQMRDEAAIARALAAPPAPAYIPPSLRRSIDQEQP